MKLKKEFIVHIAGKEAVLVPAGGAEFSGVVRGNRTLGTVLELLKEDITEDGIVRAMKDRFSAPDGVIEKDVEKVLTELRRIGAIDE